MSDNIISISDLNISFGDNHVIKNLSLNIKKGDNLAIIGGSGSGKSVLLKSIIGLIERKSGIVKINGKRVGQNVEKNSREHNISIAFQNNGIFDSMNVMQNLCFAILQKKIAKQNEAKFIAESMIERIHLHKDVLNVYPDELSGGMRKRIAVARAIITCPYIIFFDEPTTGLDPITSYHITEMIFDYIKRKDITSITITHSLKCAQKLSNKIAVIKDGKIIWYGLSDALNDSNNPYIIDFLAHAKS